MAPRAVELGAVYNIPILVASSFTDAPGTLIHGGSRLWKQFNRVRGIAHDLDVAKVTVRGVPDQPGIAASRLRAAGRRPTCPSTSSSRTPASEGLTDLTFTVSKGDLKRAVADRRAGRAPGRRRRRSPRTTARQGEHRRHRHPERARLRLAHVPLALRRRHQHRDDLDRARSASPASSREDRVADAVRALHKAFELEKAEPARAVGEGEGHRAQSKEQGQQKSPSCHPDPPPMPARAPHLASP